MQAICPSAGVRLVAINRRNYANSTPFSLKEVKIIEHGDEEERAKFLGARGHELALFLDWFIKRHNLPPISPDGKNGGIILIGWSLGCALIFAAISHADSLPIDVQSRLTKYIRKLIMHGGSASEFVINSRH